MAEVHIIGQITEAKEFPKQELFCKWYLQIGNNWKVIEGNREGQTQVASSQFSQTSTWSYPIDIHLATAGIQGTALLAQYRIRVVMLILPLLLIVILSADAKSNKTAQKPNKSAPTNITNSLKITNPMSTEPTTTELSTIDPVSTSVSSCEYNNTECIDVNVTTVSPNKNDTDVKKTTKKKHNKKLNSKIGDNTKICTCNLQINSCDINCCCDPDCSPNDKHVFGYCEIDENHFYDTRFCNYMEHIYVNNTSFVWEVNQDGLFCVISSNLPKTYLIQKEEPFESIESVKLEKHFWTQENRRIFKRESPVGLKNYGFGDSLMIVRNDSSIDNFRLPSNFVTKPCVFEEDIYFLKDVQHICSQTNIDVENAKLNFETYFKKLRVIGLPLMLNITKLKKDIFKNCPKNICLEIEAKLCNSDFTNCYDIKNNTNIKFHCSYDLKKNLNTCQHAAEKVHYRIHHNGTNGITKVEVLGVLKNFSYRFGHEKAEVIQDFSVEFMWANHFKNYSLILSGNPGYITGKPILMGTRNYNGNLTSIQRNSSIFMDNFLVFPANIGGICLKNNTYNTPVEFGYNMITQCELKSKFAIRNIQNASDICKSIQKNIFDLWGLTMEQNRSLVFGLFGNANASYLQDWNSVLYKIEPTEILNSTRGTFANKNATLLCQKMYTLFNVDIFYSMVDFKTTLNQQKLLGVVFNFQNASNYSFTLNSKIRNISSIDLSFRLVSQVSFYDITSEKTKKFVEPPSFDIRLPYDFFYPFIRVGNGISAIMPNVAVITIFLYVSFFL